MKSKLGPVKLAMWLTLVAVILASVKWISISGGPTSDDAIVAIRVAQHDVFAAKKSRSRVDTPKLNDAEGALNLALASLKVKRYDEAIAGAHKASQLARGGG